MNTAECNAYAKINLSLDITGRREDGYHTVDMVMQSVSLCDRVRVTLNDTGEVILKCSKPHIPCDGRNTAYKAAQYYFDATGVPFGADIYIEKHIPDQAGMGGGSADDAVRALNILRPVSDGDGNALFDQLIRGHGCVHIRTSDLHAHALQHQTQRPHGYAADPHKMHMMAGRQIFRDFLTIQHVCQFPHR